MNRITTFVAGALLALAAVSCGTDDPAKEHYKTTFTGQFGYVSAMGDIAAQTAPAGKVSLDIDDDNRVASVEIESLSVGGVNIGPVRLTNLSCTTDLHSVRTIRVADATSNGAVYPLRGIDMTYWPPVDNNGTMYHALYLRLTLADGRTVTLYPYKSSGIGAAEITTISTASKYVSTKMTFEVSLDPSTMTGTIDVLNPDFDPRMPTLGTMHFQGDEQGSSDIALSLDADGYTMACPRLIPSIGGDPYPRFAITDLKVTASPSENETEIEFYCAGAYAVDAVVGTLYVEAPAETATK
ncbi:MAG: hypothetical protein NC336_02780 [Clostridium sp.]|nr:hypothetical protein [Clostridium sp.]